MAKRSSQFAALVAVVGSFAVGCGARTTALSDLDFAPSDASVDDSGGSDTTITFDTTPGFDTTPRFDTSPPPPPPTDSFPPPPPPPDSSTDHGKTTGKACTSDSDCDVTRDGVNKCSDHLFGGGSYSPAPACVGVDCVAGDGTTPTPCDGDTGWCFSTGGGGGGSGGICIGGCSFDATSGAAPKGCVVGDVCNYFAHTTDPSGAVRGLGYCFGGCKVDSDCKVRGDRCQIEQGLCMGRLTTFTKKLGDPCTSADAAKFPPPCNCLAPASGNGYCTTYCEIGGAACPSGYTCDALLPAKDPSSGAPLFSAAPKGLAGFCLKNCTSDADCTALGGTCGAVAGSPGARTCQVFPPF